MGAEGEDVRTDEIRFRINRICEDRDLPSAAGRVGPEYSSELFYEDLKYTVGIDLRLMAHRQVVRVGLAWSEEGSQIWAMFGHPFSRRQLER